MSGILGHGTVLNYHNGTTYVAIGEVKEAAWTGMEREVVDISTMDDSTAFRNFTGGRVKPGEIAFKIHQLDADTDHDFIRDQLLNSAVGDTLDQYQIIFPSAGTTITFTGIMTTYEITFVDDDVVTADVKITVSGKPTVS